MSGLQLLELQCTGLHHQDLAALQRIPHVCLGFTEYTTLLLTSGSWRSLVIRGKAGFNVDFSDVDAFVRGTERFLFKCPSQEAGGLYRILRAACVRQRVACHKCEHSPPSHEEHTILSMFCQERGTPESSQIQQREAV